MARSETIYKICPAAAWAAISDKAEIVLALCDAAFGEALDRFAARDWDPARCRAQAERFGKDRFRAAFRRELEDFLGGPPPVQRGSAAP